MVAVVNNLSRMVFLSRQTKIFLVYYYSIPLVPPVVTHQRATLLLQYSMCVVGCALCVPPLVVSLADIRYTAHPWRVFNFPVKNI